METLHLPPPPPPDSSVPSPDEFLSPLYYGLIVIGMAGIVLVIYNFIFVLYCAPRRIRTPPQSLNGSLARTSQRFEISDDRDVISTFKYSKEAVASDQEEGDSDSTSFHNECVVCLSPYKDGQEVRKLVQCRHSFHAPCIDKWLHSHSDCPICRSDLTPASLICRSDLTPASSQRFQHMPEEANPTGELPVSGSTLV